MKISGVLYVLEIFLLRNYKRFYFFPKNYDFRKNELKISNVTSGQFIRAFLPAYQKPLNWISAKFSRFNEKKLLFYFHWNGQRLLADDL